jgi:CRISPR type I-E-associated protein CasB/Cse2
MNETQTQQPKPLDKLVDALVKISEQGDRGKLAALRYWFRLATQHFAYPVLADLLAKAGLGPNALDEDSIWCLIPALYAWNPNHTDEPFHNFGTTCRIIAGDKRDAFAAHFRRIMACDALADVMEILQPYVRRAAAAKVSVNYKNLGYDLFRWRKSEEDARDIKTRWSREYYWYPSYQLHG